MAYDPTHDVVVKEFPDVAIGETLLHLAIYQYKGGVKKLGITRIRERKQGEKAFDRLGRMTREEAEGLLPVIEDILEDEVWK